MEPISLVLKVDPVTLHLLKVECPALHPAEVAVVLQRAVIQVAGSPFKRDVASIQVPNPKQAKAILEVHAG